MHLGSIHHEPEKIKPYYKIVNRPDVKRWSIKDIVSPKQERYEITLTLMTGDSYTFQVASLAEAQLKLEERGL